MHFEHVGSLKANLEHYNANIFWISPARKPTTGREIDKEVIDGLLHAGDVGNKRFKAFVQGRLVVGKNHSLNLFANQDWKLGPRRKGRFWNFYQS